MAYLQPVSANGRSLIPSYESDPFISGFEVTQTSATTLTISPGICRAYNSNAVMVQNGLSINSPSYLTIDTSTIGVGGCFPISAALAAPSFDTGMGIYILGNPSEVNLGADGKVAQVAAILATGDDFLPVGYATWRRLPGTVYIDSASNNMFLTTYSGFGNDRTQMLQAGVILATASVQTLTAIDLGAPANNFPINPNFVTEVILQATYTPAAAGNILSFAPTGATTGLPPVRVKGNLAAVSIIEMVSVVPSIDPTTGHAFIYYLNTGAGDTLIITLAGWKESAGLQAI